MIIAHVDMDCFFAACEIKRDPSLKNKPVIIGATGTRGVVSTASYEARKYGIFSATPISKARRLCPDGIYLRGDSKLYRKESRAVMNILQSFADDFQQVGVDEAYLDVTTFSTKFSSLEQMGKYMRDTILQKTKLSCSIGVAKCKKIAKIASDHKKPGGVTVVKNAQNFLFPLPIQKFPGIGKKSIPYYHANDVYTLGDFISLPRFRVLDLFGMYGVRIQQICRGEYVRRIRHRGPAKSVSRERTFLEDESDMDVLLNKLSALSRKVHDDLAGREFRRVSLKLRYADFTTITRDSSLLVSHTKQEIIEKNVMDLFLLHYVGKPVRLLGVKISHLGRGEGKQMTLV